MKDKPLKYFLPEISPYRPLEASCPTCNIVTLYCSHARIRTSERAIYLWAFQCQSCGKLESSEDGHPEGVRVALESPCECGGQFRRDKNIFCPGCTYRKAEENKREDKLHASEQEMQHIKTRHGNEEME